MSGTDATPPANLDPTAADVFEALQATGFLLEQEVARRVSTFLWDRYPDRGYIETVPNYAFRDSETQKTRETDVFASVFSSPQKDGRMAYVTLELLIECKNTDNPFVVVGSPGFDSIALEETSYRVENDPLSYGWTMKDGVGQRDIMREIQFHTSENGPQQWDFIGSQLIRMNRNQGKWRANNDGIHDQVLIPLAKAVDHRRQPTSPELASDPYTDIRLIAPILVTSGPVFRVRLGIDGEYSTTRVKWTSIQRQFDSQSLNGWYVFEVVSFDHLEEFLTSRICAHYDELLECLLRNWKYLTPDWYTRNTIGKPKNREAFQAWAAMKA